MAFATSYRYWSLVRQTLGFEKPISYPAILFIVGLNLKFFYDILAALEFAVIQPAEYVAFVLLWSSIGLSITGSGHKLIRRPYLVLGSVIGLYVIALVVRGLLDSDSTYAFSRDMFAYSYVSAIFIGVKRKNWRWLSNTFVIHFVFANIAALISVIPLRSTLNYDSLIWSPVYKSWNSMYAWQYSLLIASTTGPWMRFAIIMGISFYSILIILFQKRTPLLALPVVLLALLLIMWQSKIFTRANQKNLLAIATTMIIIPVLLLAMNNSVGSEIVDAAENLGDRFRIGGSALTAIKKDGRFDEFEEAFRHDETTSTASRITRLIFGNGFGAEHDVPLAVSSSGRSVEFHNGAAGVVFKGGFILAALFTIGVFMLLRDFFWIRDRHAFVCLTIVVIAVLLSPFQSVLNTGPAWALILACTGYLISKELKPMPHPASAEIL